MRHHGCTAIPGKIAFLPSTDLPKSTEYRDAIRLILFPPFFEFANFFAGPFRLVGTSRPRLFGERSGRGWAWMRFEPSAGGFCWSRPRQRSGAGRFGVRAWTDRTSGPGPDQRHDRASGPRTTPSHCLHCHVPLAIPSSRSSHASPIRMSPSCDLAAGNRIGWTGV